MNATNRREARIKSAMEEIRPRLQDLTANVDEKGRKFIVSSLSGREVRDPWKTIQTLQDRMSLGIASCEPVVTLLQSLGQSNACIHSMILEQVKSKLNEAIEEMDDSGLLCLLTMMMPFLSVKGLKSVPMAALRRLSKIPDKHLCVLVEKNFISDFPMEVKKQAWDAHHDYFLAAMEELCAPCSSTAIQLKKVDSNIKQICDSVKHSEKLLHVLIDRIVAHSAGSARALQTGRVSSSSSSSFSAARAVKVEGGKTLEVSDTSSSSSSSSATPSAETAASAAQSGASPADGVSATAGDAPALTSVAWGALLNRVIIGVHEAGSKIPSVEKVRDVAWLLDRCRRQGRIDPSALHPIMTLLLSLVRGQVALVHRKYDNFRGITASRLQQRIMHSAPGPHFKQQSRQKRKQSHSQSRPIKRQRPLNFIAGEEEVDYDDDDDASLEDDYRGTYDSDSGGGGGGGGKSSTRRVPFQQTVPDHSGQLPLSILQGYLIEGWSYLTNFDKNKWFAVEVTDEVAPRYSAIIQHPMNLARIKKRIDAGQYRSLSEMHADVKLMVDNCKRYWIANEIVDFANKMLVKWSSKSLSLRKEANRQVAVSTASGHNSGTKKPGGGDDVNEEVDDEFNFDADDSDASGHGRNLGKLKKRIGGSGMAPTNKQQGHQGEGSSDLTAELPSAMLRNVLVEGWNFLTGKDTTGLFTTEPTNDIALGYSSRIKRPMALGTIKSRISAGRYGSLSDMDDDVVLMLNNCKRYNGPDSPFTKLAKALQRDWSRCKSELLRRAEKHLSSAAAATSTAAIGGEGKGSAPVEALAFIAPAGLSVNAIGAIGGGAHTASVARVAAMPRAPVTLASSVVADARGRGGGRPLEQLLEEGWQFLRDNDLPGVFLTKVTDDIAPGYSKIIKQPMYLVQIQRNIAAKLYTSLTRMDADVQLMLDNCVKYNGPETLLSMNAEALRSKWQQKLCDLQRDGGEVLSYPASEAPDSAPSSAPASAVLAPTAATSGTGLKERGDEEGEEEEEEGETGPAPPLPLHLLQGLLEAGLKYLRGLDGAALFEHEVTDAIAPGYSKEIKTPMCLDLISQNISSYLYNSLDEFNEDVQLIYSNCCAFNGEKSDLGLTAIDHRRKWGSKLAALRRQARDIAKQEQAKTAPVVATGATGASGATSTSSTAASKTTKAADPLQVVLMEGWDYITLQDVQNIFAKPVSRDDFPHYYTEIEHPIDLSEIRRKIHKRQYSSVEGLSADVKLMLENCRTFNPDGYWHEYAKEISRKWTKKVGTLRKHEEAAVAAVAAAAATTTTKAAAHVGTASSRGKNASIALEATVTHAATIRPILDEAWAYLTEQDRFCIFKDPVDVSIFEDYLDVVEDPMDLCTIRDKIRANQYGSLEQLNSNVQLMIQNAIMYNSMDEESDVPGEVKRIRSNWQKKIVTLRKKESALIDAVAISVTAAPAAGAPLSVQKPEHKDELPKHRHVVAEPLQSIATPEDVVFKAPEGVRGLLRDPHGPFKMAGIALQKLGEYDSKVSGSGADAAAAAVAATAAAASSSAVVNDVEALAFEFLSAADREKIFAVKLSDKIVKGYSAVVKNPMAISLMRSKKSRGEYQQCGLPLLDALSSDVALMIANCCLFNGFGSEYYQRAVQLRDMWAVFLAEAAGKFPHLASKALCSSLGIRADSSSSSSSSAGEGNGEGASGGSKITSLRPSGGKAENRTNKECTKGTAAAEEDAAEDTFVTASASAEKNEAGIGTETGKEIDEGDEKGDDEGDDGLARSTHRHGGAAIRLPHILTAEHFQPLLPDIPSAAVAAEGSSSSSSSSSSSGGGGGGGDAPRGVVLGGAALKSVLRMFWDYLTELDTDGIFAAPVASAAYHAEVTHPMDLSTMSTKLDRKGRNGYRSLQDFGADVHLMLRNCRNYNEHDSIFFQAAERLGYGWQLSLRNLEALLHKNPAQAVHLDEEHTSSSSSSSASAASTSAPSTAAAAATAPVAVAVESAGKPIDRSEDECVGDGSGAAAASLETGGKSAMEVEEAHSATATTSAATAKTASSTQDGTQDSDMTLYLPVGAGPELLQSAAEGTATHPSSKTIPTSAAPASSAAHKTRPTSDDEEAEFGDEGDDADDDDDDAAGEWEDGVEVKRRRTAGEQLRTRERKNKNVLHSDDEEYEDEGEGEEEEKEEEGGNADARGCADEGAVMDVSEEPSASSADSFANSSANEPSRNSSAAAQSASAMDADSAARSLPTVVPAHALAAAAAASTSNRAAAAQQALPEAGEAGSAGAVVDPALLASCNAAADWLEQPPLLHPARQGTELAVPVPDLPPILATEQLRWALVLLRDQAVQVLLRKQLAACLSDLARRTIKSIQQAAAREAASSSSSLVTAAAGAGEYPVPHEDPMTRCMLQLCQMSLCRRSDRIEAVDESVLRVYLPLLMVELADGARLGETVGEEEGKRGGGAAGGREEVVAATSRAREVVAKVLGLAGLDRPTAEDAAAAAAVATEQGGSCFADPNTLKSFLESIAKNLILLKFKL